MRKEAVASCTLHVGGRVVLTSEGGPPDAEYALFDPGEIELQSTEPGIVREAAYRTTARKARERLEERGITLGLAAELTSAMQPKLAATYARGAVVRSVARHMGALEMFDGKTYDPRSKQYAGAFLDLPALAEDLGLEGTATALQAVFLLSSLYEVADDAPVHLSMIEYTRGKRPGTRTHKRPSLDAVSNLATALRLLAKKEHGVPPAREAGPCRVELQDQIRARRAAASLASTRERLDAMMRASQKRERPTKGPLSNPEIWSIEEQLANDDIDGVPERLDRLEASGGRTPATTYLRERLALLTGSEDARLVAERVSALALSMTSFSELQLLAAQAWTRAGDARRAMPFARDLAENPHVAEEIRTRAREILGASAGDAANRTSSGAAALRGPSAPERNLEAPATATCPPAARPSTSATRAPAPITRPPPPRPSARPSTRPSALPPARPSERPPAGAISERPSQIPHTEHARPKASRRPSGSSKPEKGIPLALEEAPDAAIEPQPILTIEERTPPDAWVPAPARRTATAPMPAQASTGVRPTSRPPPPRRRDSPTELRSFEGPRPPSRHVAPSEALPPDPSAIPRDRPLSPALAREAERGKPAAIPAPPGAVVETRSPRSFFPDPRVEPDSGRFRAPSPSWTEEEAPRSEGPYMRGASNPPFRSDVPPSTFPASPVLPRFRPGAPPELAETLSLPPGLHGQAVQLDVLPRTVLDARVQFTHLSRELGREYRQRYRVELRADLSGIEAMQRHLYEAYADHAIETPEQALDVRRHGAFLSEILARSFGAEWVDIGPTELGYWTMIVPHAERPRWRAAADAGASPAGTRIWPFARVIRLITKGHKERDLVSYYLELQARAGAR
jgi:hypothetical protein